MKENVNKYISPFDYTVYVLSRAIKMGKKWWMFSKEDIQKLDDFFLSENIIHIQLGKNLKNKDEFSLWEK